MHNCFPKARIRTQFDKIIWNDFERPQDGPKGGGQDARSNPLGDAIYINNLASILALGYFYA